MQGWEKPVPDHRNNTPAIASDESREIADPLALCGIQDDDVPFELRDRICRLLDPADPDKTLTLHYGLWSTAASYLNDSSEASNLACVNEQRTKLRKLRRSVERTIEHMTTIAPEFAQALGRDSGNGASRFETALEGLSDLRCSIVVFDAHFKPPRGPIADRPLENAVRHLCLLLEEVTGRAPKPTMNKHLRAQPELKSPEARAIGHLLQHIDSKLTDTKIANMIEAVRNTRRLRTDRLEMLAAVQRQVESVRSKLCLAGD